jgi:hypothetical protein
MERIQSPGLVRFGVLLALMSFGLCGCGSKKGSVSGKVTYQGKLLSTGMVIFVDKDGFVSPPAGIEVDGTYSANNVPVGPVTVCVEVLPILGGDTGGDPKQPRPRYVPIPEKYKDAKQSDLKFDVKPGANDYDIELH